MKTVKGLNEKFTSTEFNILVEKKEAMRDFLDLGRLSWHDFIMILAEEFQSSKDERGSKR